MSQEKARRQLGLVSRITAGAIGEPGQRRFHLIVEAGEAQANLWLEKEQLYELALYLQQIMATISPRRSRSRRATDPSFQPSPGPASIEFKVGKLALGHDSSTDHFLYILHDVEVEEDSPASLSFWSTREQAQALTEQALKVCSAGRPICPLCNQSIGPGPHICSRSNGHAPITA